MCMLRNSWGWYVQFCQSEWLWYVYTVTLQTCRSSGRFSHQRRLLLLPSTYGVYCKENDGWKPWKSCVASILILIEQKSNCEVQLWRLGIKNNMRSSMKMIWYCLFMQYSTFYNSAGCSKLSSAASVEVWRSKDQFSSWMTSHPWRFEIVNNNKLR